MRSASLRRALFGAFLIAASCEVLAAAADEAGPDIRIIEAVDADFERATKPVDLTTGELPHASTPETLATNLDGSIAREVEPNDMPSTAMPISATSGRIRANIFPAADLDWYSFQGNAGERIYAATMTAFSPGSTDSVLTLFASDGTTVIETDNDDGSFAGTSSSIAGAVLPATGVYYLRVEAGSASSTIRPYDLYFHRRGGAPSAEVEPNDLSAGGQTMPAGGWVLGTISPSGDNDVFGFALQAGDTVFLSLDLDPSRVGGTTWNGRLGLGNFGNPPNVLIVNDSSTTSPNSESFFFTVKDAGTYYAFVDAGTPVTAPSLYHLSATIFPRQPATAACTTHVSTNVPVAIPSGPGTVTSTLTVPAGSGRIADLDVAIRLTHANMPDLDVSLTAPGGNEVVLFTDPGSSLQTGMDLRLDDEAAISVASYSTVSGMAYSPAATRRLSWFDGQLASGTWTLTIRDDLASNDGTLQGWSLTVCEAPPPPSACPIGAFARQIGSTDFEANDGGYQAAGTAVNWAWGTPSAAPIIGCASGTGCWKTNLSGTYSPNSEQYLISPPIDLTAAVPPLTLEWAMKYQMESATFDQAVARLRFLATSTATEIWRWLDGTMTATVGSPAVAIQQAAGWGVHRADLAPFVGQRVSLEFALTSDPSANFAGLAIDDVRIDACFPQAVFSNGFESP